MNGIRERMGEKRNMSTLEEKVDALLYFCMADNKAARKKCRQYLQHLVTVETAAQAQDRKSRIDQALMDLGIPDHLLGYGYLQTAIEICLINPDALGRFTAFVYQTVAQQYDTRWQLVERGMRHAIETGWTRCDLDMQQRYFGGKVDQGKGKPSNKEFVARVCNVVRSRGI